MGSAHEIDPAAKAEGFLKAIRFSRELGMQLDMIGGGKAALSMPYNENLVGDSATGVLHGGAVSALLDTCCGVAVLCDQSGPESAATLNLRIDYMRAAKPGCSITATAECYHVTRTVAFVRAEASDGTGGLPVATAAGTFSVERAKT